MSERNGETIRPGPILSSPERGSERFNWGKALLWGGGLFLAGLLGIEIVELITGAIIPSAAGVIVASPTALYGALYAGDN